jgi:hypothetical protein
VKWTNRMKRNSRKVSPKCHSLFFKISQKRCTTRAAQGAGQPISCPGRHWNNRKYGSSILWFPYAKEFLRKLFALSVCALKNIRKFCPSPKTFKEYRFERTPNYSRNPGPHVSRTGPLYNICLETFSFMVHVTTQRCVTCFSSVICHDDKARC